MIHDSEPICDLCGSWLTIENELSNRVCLSCQANDERERRLEHYDEMLNVYRIIYNFAPGSAASLCPDCAKTWENIVERLRGAIAYGGVL